MEQGWYTIFATIAGGSMAILSAVLMARSNRKQTLELWKRQREKDRLEHAKRLYVDALTQINIWKSSSGNEDEKINLYRIRAQLELFSTEKIKEQFETVLTRIMEYVAVQSSPEDFENPSEQRAVVNEENQIFKQAMEILNDFFKEHLDSLKAEI